MLLLLDFLSRKILDKKVGKIQGKIQQYENKD